LTTADGLSASLEDYLEAIFHVVAEKHAARAKDIGKRMHVSRSSVTGALHTLAGKGLVNYAPYDLITLTKKGEAAARDVVRRHEVLRDFFVGVLAVDADDADEAACKMEHAIPGCIMERFVEFVEFLEACPRAGSKWIRGFGYYCDHGTTDQRCEKCVRLCLEEIRNRRMEQQRGGGQTVTLKDLKPGQKGRITKISGRSRAGRRLLDMGVTTGSVVEMERVAPLGDPIEIKVRGYHLSLRKDQAEGIRVEVR